MAVRAASVFRLPLLSLVALLGAFLLGRIAVWRGGQVFVAPDTATYVYGNDPSVYSGQVLSFTGNAPRLWGAPLLYAMLPDDTARAFGQWAIGTFAWALLAWAVWGCLRHQVARFAAVAALILLGLMPEVTNWDFALLSESLSINLGLITLALFLRWTVTRSWWSIAGMSIVSLWWSFTRVEAGMTVAFLALVLGIIAWRDSSRRLMAMTGLVVMLVTLGWLAAITPGVNQNFAHANHADITQDESGFLYRLRLQVLTSGEIKSTYTRKLGMPACPEADRVAAGPSWDMANFIDAYLNCPELRAWGKANASSSGFRFPIAAPGQFIASYWSAAPDVFAGERYAQAPTVTSQRLQQLAFPAAPAVLPTLFGGLVAGILLCWLTGAFRRRRTLTVTALAIVVVSLATSTAGFMVCVGEDGRYGIQEAIGVRIAIGLLLVAALDAFLERRGRLDWRLPALSPRTSAETGRVTGEDA